jgi:hypothetical protein
VQRWRTLWTAQLEKPKKKRERMVVGINPNGGWHRRPVHFISSAPPRLHLLRRYEIFVFFSAGIHSCAKFGSLDCCTISPPYYSQKKLHSVWRIQFYLVCSFRAKCYAWGSFLFRPIYSLITAPRLLNFLSGCCNLYIKRLFCFQNTCTISLVCCTISLTVCLV